MDPTSGRKNIAKETEGVSVSTSTSTLADNTTQDKVVNINRCLSPESSSLKTSYCLNTLYRLVMLHRVVAQTLSHVVKCKNELEELLLMLSDKRDLKSCVEYLEMRVCALRTEVDYQKKRLDVLRENKSKNENEVCERGIEMLHRFEQLRSEKERVTEKRRKLNEHREKLTKTLAQLTIQRKKFATELMKIYPIVPFPDQRGGFSINGVYLPNSEDFEGRDDFMISVALGYVSHTLIMLSRFLDLPLCYQIKYFGSRSSIIDHINNKIVDSDRTFPLYPKSGKMKLYFSYGVFLLNKNISQLRQYFGLSQPDLRATLYNMFTLFEEKLRSVVDDEELDASTSTGITSRTSTPIPIEEYLRRELQAMQHNSHMPSISLPNSTAPQAPQVRSPVKPSNPINTTKFISRSLDKGLNDIERKRENSGSNQNSDSSSVCAGSIPTSLMRSSQNKHLKDDNQDINVANRLHNSKSHKQSPLSVVKLAVGYAEHSGDEKNGISSSDSSPKNDWSKVPGPPKPSSDTSNLFAFQSANTEPHHH